ncbi:hypothetical protein FA95DRAFT_317090 [Auriscalpium vulgare]|uniref:Uncharacterized protein n=1 Tax=Auriscalpium vulgare TaxID=40419 RepID=A0ACB8S5K3_9AGAM|nr:hypothetical protein FA95DRAFT_317090 [Auriscalpium vulgare]
MSSHSSDQLHTPATSPSTPTQPLSNPIFDRAIQDHLKLLDDSERRDFIASTPDDVRNVAAGYHAGHGQSRFLLCVQRVSRVIAPLEQFFSAVDNGVSSNPVLAGIVWGALRFVMQAIRGVSAHLGKIGNVLEEIAEALPHYQDYAVILFSNSQRVMEGLAGVYGDILLTCTTIRRIYMRAQGKRRTFSVAIRFLNPSSFDDIVSRLRQRLM